MVKQLPVELAARFPHPNHLKYKGNNEWSSSCPFCGGEDRFVMWGTDQRGNARYWCRVCNSRGYADAATKEQIAVAIKDREMAREEVRRRREELIGKLREDAYWKGYHDAMSIVARHLWQERGLPDDAQDHWKLGYTDKMAFGPALSIPHFGHQWELLNVQYRLLNTNGHGKYRYTEGIPASPFWADPDASSNRLIVAEGAIKAAVTYWKLAMEEGLNYSVIGLPNKTPAADMLSELGAQVGGMFDVAYIILDPDATPGEQTRVGAAFTGCDVRYVALPGKVDDMLLGGISAKRMDTAYIDRASRVAVA